LNVTALYKVKPMSEGFKILICVLGLMLVFGELHLFSENSIFPPWVHLIMAFYVVLLWIDERLIPLMKDIDDLFDKG